MVAGFWLPAKCGKFCSVCVRGVRSYCFGISCPGRAVTQHASLSFGIRQQLEKLFHYRRLGYRRVASQMYFCSTMGTPKLLECLSSVFWNPAFRYKPAAVVRLALVHKYARE